MKTLKFKHDFVEEILNGRKSTTWRLFDDKDLKINDGVELVDASNGNCFGKAIIIEVKENKILDLTEEELKNHEYENREKMLESHRKYYGEKVNTESIVKIIKFKLL